MKTRRESATTGRGSVARLARELAATASSAAMRGREVLVAAGSDPRVNEALWKILHGAQELFDCAVGIELGLIPIVHGPSDRGEPDRLPLFAGTAPEPTAADPRSPIFPGRAGTAPAIREPSDVEAVAPVDLVGEPTPGIMERVDRREPEGDGHAEQAAEPPLDAMLRKALLRRGGAEGRWNKRRALGCTDDEIRDAVGMELTGPGSDSLGYHARGAPDPAFFLGAWKPGRWADLKGDALVAGARRVMRIPMPPASPRPAAAKRRKAAKGS